MITSSPVVFSNNGDSKITVVFFHILIANLKCVALWLY